MIQRAGLAFSQRVLLGSVGVLVLVVLLLCLGFGANAFQVWGFLMRADFWYWAYRS